MGAILVTSLGTPVDVFQLKLFFTPTLENFSTIFQPPYLIHEKLLNSAIVSISVVIISSPLTTCAAYAFSRFRMRGERIMLVTILAIQFVPAVVIVLPLFLMFRSLGMLDTQR